MSVDLVVENMITKGRINILETEVKALKENITNSIVAELKSLKEMITGQQSEKTFSVPQVAKQLGISPAGVNDHIRKGNIKTKGNKGRFKEITETELNRYIESKKK